MVNKSFFWFLFLTFYPFFFLKKKKNCLENTGGGGGGGYIHWQNDPSHHQLRTEILKKSRLLVDGIIEKNDWLILWLWQVRDLVPESQAYMDLLAFERKLDATIMRKRLDIQEALKRPMKVKVAETGCGGAGRSSFSEVRWSAWLSLCLSAYSWCFSCMVPWFSGERQWLSTTVFSPVVFCQGYLALSSWPLKPALGACGTVFRDPTRWLGLIVAHVCWWSHQCTPEAFFRCGRDTCYPTPSW